MTKAATYPHGPADDVSISISSTPAEVLIQTSPVSGEAIGINKDSATVTTNSIAGYKLSLNFDDPVDNTLTHTINSSEHINSLSSNNIPLASDTWGYTLSDPSASPSTSNFNTVPNSTNPVLLKSKSTEVTSDVTDVYYGANTSINLIAGAYIGTVAYTALANTVSPPTIQSVLPNSGPQIGGTEITLNGTEFNSLINIKVGESDCSNIQIFSNIVATCVTSASDVDGLVDVEVINQGGRDVLEDSFTYIPDTFRFTVDTRMTDTLDNNASHYSGTSRQFSIPTSGFVYGIQGHEYRWLVNCNTISNQNNFTAVSGSSSASSGGIPCNYSTPGEYQITIKSDGAPNPGWMNAFGFYEDWATGANVQSNRNMLKSIDSQLTNNMREPNSNHRFSFMFSGARNAVAPPSDLFANVVTTGDTNMNSIFYNTFAYYSFNMTSETIPSGLFDFIDTSSATDLGSAFKQTFERYAVNSASATIPSGLFSTVNVSGATDISYMFASTFLSYAYESTVGDIPSGLFGSIQAGSNCQANSLFEQTFSFYAARSGSASITADLFQGIQTNQAIDLSYAFYKTFHYYAAENYNGTIPSGLLNNINASSATNLNGMFQETFSSYTRESYSGGIPDNLFASLNTNSVITAHNMFDQTFFNYSRNSYGGTIPTGLFSTVKTTNTTEMYYMFNATFANYSGNADFSDIPQNLFQNITTAKAENLSSLFNSTFLNYGLHSTGGNIPTGLFSSVNTTNATNLDSIFYRTFERYAVDSTAANIPVGLFNGVSTANVTNVRYAFSYTFHSYAYASTVGSIPTNFFTNINLTKATNVEGMFNNTFSWYANQNVFDNVNDTNIINVWGNANFANKVTAANAGGANGVFFKTFDSFKPLTGTALTFINTKLGGITPNSGAATFYDTNVSDYWSLPNAWKFE